MLDPVSTVAVVVPLIVTVLDPAVNIPLFAQLPPTVMVGEYPEQLRVATVPPIVDWSIVTFVPTVAFSTRLKIACVLAPLVSIVNELSRRIDPVPDVLRVTVSVSVFEPEFRPTSNVSAWKLHPDETARLTVSASLLLSALK